jgi:hypothetical protein
LVNPKEYKISLEKKSGFYEMDKKSEMIIEYKPLSGDKKSVAASEIRMIPDYFATKDQIKKTNIPREIEICFSMNGNFTDAKKIVRKFKEKDFYYLINKRNYLSLYRGKEIECRYIRIKILKTADDNNDMVKIRDIEILKR